VILQDLQHYLRSHPKASLEELAQHFCIDVGALRGMLTPLIRKGRVRKLEDKQCGNCCSCAPES
jgi:putative ferrous iron transport protein C